MPRLRLLSLLALLVAVSVARPARAQDNAGADSLANQLQNKFDPNEAEHAKQKAQQEKAQKKQEKASNEQAQENNQKARTEQAQENGKPESAKPVRPQPKPQHTKAPAKQTTASDGPRKHWWSMPHLRRKPTGDSSVSQVQPKSKRKTGAAKPASKTAGSKRSSHDTASSASAHKTAARKIHSNSAVAANKSTTQSAIRPHGKTVSATAHSSKPARQNCSASEEKKGNCKVEPKQTARATMRQS